MGVPSCGISSALDTAQSVVDNKPRLEAGAREFGHVGATYGESVGIDEFPACHHVAPCLGVVECLGEGFAGCVGNVRRAPGEYGSVGTRCGGQVVDCRNGGCHQAYGDFLRGIVGVVKVVVAYHYGFIAYVFACGQCLLEGYFLELRRLERRAVHVVDGLVVAP